MQLQQQHEAVQVQDVRAHERTDSSSARARSRHERPPRTATTPAAARRARRTSSEGTPRAEGDVPTLNPTREKRSPHTGNRTGVTPTLREHGMEKPRPLPAARVLHVLTHRRLSPPPVQPQDARAAPTCPTSHRGAVLSPCLPLCSLSQCAGQVDRDSPHTLPLSEVPPSRVALARC